MMIDPEPWVKILLSELWGIQKRAKELRLFLEEGNKLILERERHLIMEQLHIMVQYERILESRLPPWYRGKRK